MSESFSPVFGEEDSEFSSESLSEIRAPNSSINSLNSIFSTLSRTFKKEINSAEEAVSVITIFGQKFQKNQEELKNAKIEISRLNQRLSNAGNASSLSQQKYKENMKLTNFEDSDESDFETQTMGVVLSRSNVSFGNSEKKSLPKKFSKNKEFNLLLQNAQEQVKDLKDQLNDLNESFSSLNADVESIIPDEIKRTIPNKNQKGYVVSVVKALSSHFLAHEASDYTDNKIQDALNEKDDLAVKYAKLQEEYTKQKVMIKNYQNNEIKMKRVISESERVRKEACEASAAKDEQIQTLEEERKNLIKKISEEIKERDEKIQILSAAKIGNRLTNDMNLSDSSGAGTPKKDSEMNKQIRKLKNLLKKANNEQKEKDERIKKQENDLIGVQNELLQSQKSIEELKKLVEEKNNLIFEYENQKLESSNLESINTKQLQEMKAKVDDYRTKLEECKKQLQLQLKKPQKIDETNQLRSIILDKDAEIQNLGESLHTLSIEKEELQTKYEGQISQIKKQEQTSREKANTLTQELEKLKVTIGENDSQSMIESVNRMKEQNASLVQTVKDSQVHIKELHDQLSQTLQQSLEKDQKTLIENSQLKATLVEKEKALNEAKESIKEKDDTIIQLKSSLQNTADLSEYQSLTIEKNKLEENLNEKEEFIKQLQENVSGSIENVRQSLNEQADKYSKALEKTTMKLQKKKARISDLEMELLKTRRESEQTMTILKEKLRNALSESAELGSEIEENKEKEKKLNDKIKEIQESHEKEQANLKDTILKLETEKMEMTKKCESLKEENEQSNKKVAKMTKKLSELQSSVSQSETHMRQLEESMEKMKSEKSQTIEGLKLQIAEKEKQINETEMSYKELASSRSALETTINEEQKTNKEKIEKFEKKVQKLEKIITKLKEYINNMQVEKAKYEGRFKELKKIAKDNMSAAQEAQTTAAKLSESNKTTEIAFNQLTKKFNQLQTEFDNKNETIQAMSEDMQNYRLQLNEKAAELANTKIQLSKTETQLAESSALQETIKRLQTESAFTKQKLEESDLKLSDLTTQYQAQISKLENEKENLENKCSSLKGAISSLKSSNTFNVSEDEHKQLRDELIQREKEFRETLKGVEKERNEIQERTRIQEKVIADDQIKIKELKQEIDELNDTIDKNGTSFENKLAAKVREIQDSRAREDNLKVSLKTANSTIQSLREELQATKLNLTHKSETLTTNLTTVKKQKESVDVTLKGIQSQKNELEKRLAVVEKQLSEKEKAYNETSESLSQVKDEFEETRRVQLQEREKSKNEINKLVTDNKNLVNALSKKQAKLSKYKEAISNMVPLTDFEKLNKKYVAIKNLQTLSEKKVMSIAIDQGTIREQQLKEFLQKEDERKKEIDDLHDQLEEKKEMIRKLQRQIQTDGLKLEEITSKPFVPLEELTTVKKQLREKERSFNEMDVHLKIVEEQKAKVQAEFDQFQKQNEKEVSELRALVDRLSQKNTTFSEINAKVDVFHSMLLSDSVQNVSNSSLLSIIKDSLNDLFSYFAFEPLKVLGKMPTLIHTHDEIASAEPFVDNRLNLKIDEIKNEIYEFPVPPIVLSQSFDTSTLARLSQVLVLLQHVKSTLADRDALIKNMSVLIESQHNAVVKISNSPNDKEAVEESQRNYEESQKILEELSKAQ